MASSAIEEIKLRLDVADVIGPYVALKRSGRSQKGLCPFHGEKTPSFHVFSDTSSWHCFGCGEGGDIFTFVQKRENMDFGEALRTLAERAGVELPSREARRPEEQAVEDRLRAGLAAAELYFRAALEGTAGQAARSYLEHRGVSGESVERFGLGWAPSRGLLRHLEASGFSEEDATEVGLASRGDDGRRYEMFRERLMFPIRDASGKTIGFGGRTLGGNQPKYLNGPQTRFFDKGGSLFALDLARTAIRQAGQAVIVEGYLDALIAHQQGYQNVVATLGTALTPRHLDLLGRQAREIILALDADAAGQAATLRGLEVAQQAPGDTLVPVPTPGLGGLVRYQSVRQSQIKVLTMPPGLDPDELIRRDSAEWGRLVGDAMPVVDFLLSRLGERHDLASAGGKREAVQEAMGVIRDLTDPVVREHYLQRLASIVGLDESGLRQVLNRVRPRAFAPATPVSQGIVHELPEAYALALAYLHGPDGHGLASDDLSTEGRAIYGLLTTVAADQRRESTLADLVETAEPTLRPGLSEVAGWLPKLNQVEPERRARELEVVGLKIKQQRLRLRHREVLALLDDAEPVAGAGSPASMLSAIAAQLKEIEAALAARRGIGSLVWRSRQVGEVFGG